MARLLGSIDIGTSRVKAIAFNEDFNPTRTVEWRLNITHRGVSAEQDPLELARAVKAAVARLREWGVCCIGVSVYRGSVLAWKVDGSPLTRIVTWMDRRTLCFKPSLLIRLASRLPVIGKAFRPGSPALAMKLLTDTMGLHETLKRGEALLWTIDAYVAHVLYGKPVADPSSAVLTGLIHPIKLEKIGFTASILGLKHVEPPEIKPHDEITGSVGGLAVGPIIADQQAASIGLGCLSKGCVKISMGTGVFVDAATVEPLLSPSTDIVTVLTLWIRSGRWYGVEGFAAGVGAVVDSLVELGILDYELLGKCCRLGRDQPPLIALPLTGGLRTPYIPEAEALIVGPVTARESLCSATCRGIALLTAHIARRITGYVKAKGSVRVGGGLARSRPLVELLASLLAKHVERLPDGYDASRGAALLSAYVHGVIGKRELFNPPLRLETVEAVEEFKQPPLDFDRLVENARRVWKTYVEAACRYGVLA